MPLCLKLPMSKKYLYALLICLTILTLAVPRVLGASDYASAYPTDRPCTYHEAAYTGLQLPKLSSELTTTGLIGNIHGAAGTSQMFVLSVREPDNFFSYRQFSLVAKEPAILDNLKQLHRHDRVCIRGNLIANPSPQKHIAVDSVQVLEPWSQPEGFTPYERQVDWRGELSQQTSLTAKVHAIAADGKILVVEYHDGIIPIFVTTPEYTQDLYRGDIIQLAYQIQSYPQQPTHLQLDTSVAEPVKVLDAIVAHHDREQVLTGSLVKFPQSPQIKFDVYALEVDTQGSKRYFTLVNLDDMAEFERIRTKLAQIWQENAATARSGRNMLINPTVQIEAQGLINVVSPEQANPQILLESAAQVKQL